MNNYEEVAVEAEELSLAATRTRTRNNKEDLRARSTSRIEGRERSVHDLEKGQSAANGAEREHPDAPDPNVVTWQGKDDPANPKNWPRKRKWAATFVSMLDRDLLLEHDTDWI